MSYFIVGLVCLLIGGVLDHFFGTKVEKDMTGAVVSVYRKGEKFVREKL